MFAERGSRLPWAIQLRQSRTCFALSPWSQFTLCDRSLRFIVELYREDSPILSPSHRNPALVAPLGFC